MNVFSAKGSSPPVFAAARAYSQLAGREVKVSVCQHGCGPDGECGPPGSDGFTPEVLGGEYDMAVAGSESDMDELDRTGKTIKASRRSLGIRQAALLVPRGNPAGIATLEDLTRPGIRIAISTIDCMRAVWEDVAGRAGLIEEVRANLTHKVTGCIAFMDVIARKKVDAGIGWSSFARMNPGLVAIDLPPELRVYRSTCITILERCQDVAAAEAFVAYLLAEQGQATFAGLGWLPRGFAPGRTPAAAR
ncbi:MAG: substrate-binding domain-containing protein [Candidatus Sericytochromatia bacterium]|nr:substrate-binding domain-containing protein [Candidatus Tanganyikabacteria bacterium]